MHYLLCRLPNGSFSEQICYDSAAYVMPDTEWTRNYTLIRIKGAKGNGSFWLPRASFLERVPETCPSGQVIGVGFNFLADTGDVYVNRAGVYYHIVWPDCLEQFFT